jgi:selenophosphate synthetase-related protein
MEQTLELLLSRIADRRKTIEVAIVDGASKDYSQYQHSVGLIQGLATAESIIKDLAKTMETYDDDE